MTCPYCKKPMLSGSRTVQFCWNCGRPVAQLCPYEDTLTGTLVELRDAQGHSPQSCKHCLNLFKACHVCSRLHQLEDLKCRTSTCQQNGAATILGEPSQAFPSSQGTLAGTREAPYPVLLRSPVEMRFTASEEIQTLVFRYGLLIGLTRQDLITHTWNGSGWVVRDRTPLAAPLSEAKNSLIVDSGHAYVLRSHRSYVVKLSGNAAVRMEFAQNCVHQAKSFRWWLRIGEFANEPCSQILITDCHSLETRSIPLNVPASEVHDIVLEDDIAVIATEDSLLIIDPVRGTCQPLDQLPQKSWRRVARKDDVVIALSVNNSFDTHLQMIDLNGQPRGQHALGPGYLPNFAWSNEDLYLMQQTVLVKLRTTQLSQFPRTVALQQVAMGTDENFFILINPQGTLRLLTLRITPRGGYQPCLVTPETGAQVNLGEPLGTRPILCIADSLIVVATSEGQGTKIRSYYSREKS